MKFLSFCSILLLYVLLQSKQCLAQKVDTIWYNNKWEVIYSQSARHYYRTVETINDHTFFVRDFYETGKIQMEGYFSSIKPEIKDGDFTYWYRNGNTQMKNTYKQNVLTKVLQFDENGNITNRWEQVIVGKDSKGKDITRIIELAPQFPGGTDALENFIKKNLNYPSAIADKKETGKVLVRFIVKSNGKISNIGIVESLNPLFDAEVISLIKKMPKWEPGKLSGKFIDMQVMLPIVYN